MTIYTIVHEEHTTYLVEADSPNQAINKFTHDDEDRKAHDYSDRIVSVTENTS